MIASVKGLTLHATVWAVRVRQVSSMSCVGRGCNVTVDAR